MAIQSKPNNPAYEEGWERIFGKGRKNSKYGIGESLVTYADEVKDKCDLEKPGISLGS